MRPSVKVGGREKNKNNAGKSEQFLCFGDSRVSIDDAFGKSYTVRNFAVIMKKKMNSTLKCRTRLFPRLNKFSVIISLT